MSNVNPMPGGCGFDNIIFKAVVDLCSYPDSVLELGCGNGGNLAKFAKSTRREGIDPHLGNINEAIDLHQHETKFVLGNHQHLSWHIDNLFDVGFTVSVIDHIEHPQAAISELMRVCKQVILLEPYLKGENRQARKGETSHWQVTWYHDYKKILQNCNTNVKFTIKPLPLYKTNSGPLFHLIHWKAV